VLYVLGHKNLLRAQAEVLAGARRCQMAIFSPLGAFRSKKVPGDRNARHAIWQKRLVLKKMFPIHPAV
jgi:hypothetical protein